MPSVELQIVESGIAVLRCHNPPTGLLNGAMAVELDAHVTQLAADPAVRVLILTGGQPDVFIRHFDVQELAMAADSVRAAPPPPDVEWDSSLFHRITRALETMAKPTIAAINGVCMGVGFELALACDLRIAGRGDYPIGLPEVNIGICPGGGGTVRLTRLLGPARAQELLFTATTCAPEHAAALGMVNVVAEDALTAALALAKEMSVRSAAALAAIKRVCQASADLGIEAALTVEQRVVNQRLASAEMAALMRHMNERGLDIRDVRAPK